MKKAISVWASEILFLAATAATGGTAGPISASVVQERADALLRKMTQEEKIGQLSVLFAFAKSLSLEKKIQSGELGNILFVSDPAQINKLQRIAMEQSRLHIPMLFGLDVIHGLRTIFPVPIAMAASWDPSLVERSQSIAAEEARSVGIGWTYAPMVDIARDPRWGRIVEGAGEDPYLGSAMAAAQVRGFQGQYIGDPKHVVACVKHFAGYGAAEGGRDYEAADVSDDQLWNVYFPPFHSAVNAGVESVMSAYMDLNGVPATGNNWLLRDVLRDKWRFKGFVVTDSNATKDLVSHGFAEGLRNATLRAFDAGVNVEMALGQTAYSANLLALLKEGRITEAQLDNAVRPVLETKIRLGLFEHPYADETIAKQTLLAPDHRTASRRAAERSAVLLRNEGGLLPLKAAAYKKIAVIGPLADSRIDTAGSWVLASEPKETVTVLSGLRNQAQAGIEFRYAQGAQTGSRKFASPFDALLKEKHQPAWTEEQAGQEFTKAVQLVNDTDLALMVLGEAEDMTGEIASRSSLELPGRQQQLLEAVVKTGKPVVLVLMNGRPLDITWASEHVSAILEAWYPGSEGGNAIAELLYGKAVPGGKLPFTWPRNVGQIPIFYAHNITHAPNLQGKRYWNEESTPLFPFGFGLSYAKFVFSNLQVSNAEIRKGEAVEISVDIKNTSDVSGDEVVQLYLHQQYGTSSRPVRELKGFQRLTLSPHQMTAVRFTISAEDLTYWSEATKSWIEDASTFDLWAGGESNAALHATFAVKLD